MEFFNKERNVIIILKHVMSYSNWYGYRVLSVCVCYLLTQPRSLSPGRIFASAVGGRSLYAGSAGLPVDLVYFSYIHQSVHREQPADARLQSHVPN